ncbi:hypothetical protein [Actinoplanes couchii]|uniref:Uncharacterized protein n=1 Tax=Actinoplanes couchii TaxID=403638 RepID=A0ABQ3XTH2_9ACTN|nr:hypothetical protein [Actinoplanes couchii]MDR6318698.1 hypothetical protein [Actinoplanes couchii]GID61795.1 hypothetical protein Aco03nite_101990 [Actinoplanes couchii]
MGPAATDWGDALTTSHGSPLAMVGVALLVFPKLALGLSGFETGVAVVPHIKGDLPQRIRGGKQLLTTAAAIMSVFLVTSSLTATILIPAEEFQPGGEANGREYSDKIAQIIAWTEGNPVAKFARYLIVGQGEVAPVTREMIRRAEPERNRRPHIHVG